MARKSVFLLGRQPEIGIAELESLYGHEKLKPISSNAVSMDISPSLVNFDRLGGTIKLAELLGEESIKNPKDLSHIINNYLLETCQKMQEGKIHVGISYYGFNVNFKSVLRAGFQAKKFLKSHGYSIHLVPNKDVFLNSAQVIHNKLTDERGIELIIIKSGKYIYFAKSVKVQAIESYSVRDYGRPKRDTRVGMLPPKLAQSIINLAVGTQKTINDHVVLDPFCGTGVVLQEALIMGYGAYGSDINEKMIEFTKDNLLWLSTKTGKKYSPKVIKADATNFQWESPISAVASEIYLGRAFSNWPDDDVFKENVHNCNAILESFLNNITKSISKNTRLCLAIPVWINPKNGFIYHLQLLDHLDNLGYNRLRFSNVDNSKLVYYRPNQIVGRELLLLLKK